MTVITSKLPRPSRYWIAALAVVLGIAAYVFVSQKEARESTTPLPMSQPHVHVPGTFPAKVAELCKEVNEARNPDEAYRKTFQILGKEHRITGSAVASFEWDVDGGMIECQAGGSPIFVDKAENMVPLRRTHNTIDENLFGSFELSAPRLSDNEIYTYYLGNVDLFKDGTYGYRDDDAIPKLRYKQAKNYFILFPIGMFEVQLAPGLTGDSHLEDIADKSVVARIDLQGQLADGSFDKPRSLFVRNHQLKYRQLTIESAYGGKLPYSASRSWRNWWK